MKSRFWLATAFLLTAGLLAGLLLAAPRSAVQAQAPQQSYALTWHTVDGGGGTWSSGGSYALGGTAGQPDAGVLSGGAYTLGGGFWKGGAVATIKHKIYLPLALRRYAP